MDLPMPQEINGNPPPVPQSCSESNGFDTAAAKKAHMSNIELSEIQQKQDTGSKHIDTLGPNGLPYSPKQKAQHDNDKTALNESPHSNSNTSGSIKNGASSPTEHKQLLHLPLRKRHLLASSTGNFHADSHMDTNHGTPSSTPSTATVTNTNTNTNTQLESSDSTHPPSSIHPSPSSSQPHPTPHEPSEPLATTATTNIEPHNNTQLTTTDKTIEPPEPPEPMDITPTGASRVMEATELGQPNPSSSASSSQQPQQPSVDIYKATLSETPSSSLHEGEFKQEGDQGDVHGERHKEKEGHGHERAQELGHTQHQDAKTEKRTEDNEYEKEHDKAHSREYNAKPSSSSPSSYHPPTSQSPQKQHTQFHSHTQQSPQQHQQHSQTPSQQTSPRSTVNSGRQTSSSSRGRGAGRGRGRKEGTPTTSPSHNTLGNSGGGTSTGSTSSATSASEELYCFCRRPYDPTVDVFMICCDSCDEWYHGQCVGVNQREAKKIGRYVCPRCKKIPISPTSTAVTSPDVSSEGEPSSPPTSSSRSKKRKGEASAFKTDTKRQALSPTVADNGVESPPQGGAGERERACLNCGKPAQLSSKYCGDQCGLEYARKQYTNKMKPASSSPPPSLSPPGAADIADKETLADIAKKKSDIVEKLLKLDKEQQELEKAILFSRRFTSSVPSPSSPLPTSPNPPASPPLSHDNSSAQQQDTNVKNPSTNSSHHNSGNTAEVTMDCISCGHPIAVSKYTLHMERCYHKKESNVLMVGTTADDGNVFCNVYDSKTKTFCKKLRNACTAHASKRQPTPSTTAASSSTPSSSHSSSNGNTRRGGSSAAQSSSQLCGCPTEDFQSGHCELLRKSCVKHYNWEELMRDSIANQRAQHNKILNGLEAEERTVKLRMHRRNQPSTSSHRTIVEA